MRARVPAFADHLLERSALFPGQSPMYPVVAAKRVPPSVPPASKEDFNRGVAIDDNVDVSVG